jgi:hypothetical protein
LAFCLRLARNVWKKLDKSRVSRNHLSTEQGVFTLTDKTQTTDVLTVDILKKGIEAMSWRAPELRPEETIGDPSDPMTDFEKVIRRNWFANGGIGNPPKVIVNEALAKDMRELGCPDHLMTIMRLVL